LLSGKRPNRRQAAINPQDLSRHETRVVPEEVLNQRRSLFGRTDPL
jgi:hypothetical protein